MIEPVSTRLAVRLENADAGAIAAGLDWYPTAQRAARAMARDAGVTTSAAAAAIAAYSPRCQWADNLRRARSHLAGRPVGMRSAIDRCNRALAAPRGRRAAALFNGGSAPKVSSFYRNIMGDESAVTVDVWAARAAGVSEAELSRKGGYDLVAGAYRRAAAMAGFTPAQLQAAIWCDIRGKAD